MVTGVPEATQGHAARPVIAFRAGQFQAANACNDLDYYTHENTPYRLLRNAF
jgi:hypothetical protein